MKGSIKSLIIYILTVLVFSSWNNVFAQETIKSVKIGNQTWMAENLNVDRFQNGDLIPEANTDKEWYKAQSEGTPAWCYYENNSENGKKYGKLYNWFAVNDKRGLAPKGWHIPSLHEINVLAKAVNRNSNALKAKGQGTGLGAGTNESGFSALLVGSLYGSSILGNTFIGLDTFTNYWCSTENEYNNEEADIIYLGNVNSIIKILTQEKDFGNSVRCIKD